MKTLTVFAVSIMLFSSTAHTQSYDTTQYFGRMNYVFQHVNKSQITTGLLRDYGIELLNLDNYTGTTLHDSNL